MMILRDLVDMYLRQHPDWREQTRFRGSHMQWIDALASETDQKFLPSDLAAVRQMARERRND